MQDPQSSPRQTANYIEEMLVELGSMSRAANTPVLTYLLEMAEAEAADIASGRTLPANQSRK
ncbi:MAG: hypothetical protein OXR62_09870 [Ahrensia sp.]|nr:hypothetical protein [Ahrensia sp.]